VERIKKDAIVVGLGAWGSSTLWRLARRGLSVAGIEQYQLAHNLGSSHGTTRVFRIACSEHPRLAPIALKTFEL
jgi:sarcosine oxidase